MEIESVNNEELTGLLVPQENAGGPGNGQPHPMRSFFDVVVSYIEDTKLFIGKAAALEGGWEKWLQAALSVHLREQVDVTDVRREVCAYSKSADMMAEYRRLMHKPKSRTNQIRADLVVTPKDTNEKFVIEIKCESSAMTEKARQKEQAILLKAGTIAEGKIDFVEYVAKGICEDAMKLNMGFDPAHKVAMAAICVVTTSKLVRDAMKVWNGNGNEQERCYHHEFAGTGLSLYMWYVSVLPNGKWEDDGHAPNILRDYMKLMEEDQQNVQDGQEVQEDEEGWDEDEEEWGEEDEESKEFWKKYQNGI